MFLYDDKKRKVDFEDAIRPTIDNLKTSFQNNVNLIYNKLVSLGSTPVGKEPSQISNAIQAINDSIYNKLATLGQTPASKVVADLNAKIQALTEIRWSQALSIAPVSYTDSEGSHTLSHRYIPLNCKNVVNIVITYTLGGGMTIPISLGEISWYNASGGLVRQDVIINNYESAGAHSKTFTPPAGASRAEINFTWNDGIVLHMHVEGNFGLTTTYQTKVLR
jgi:hypothetical protein